MEYDLIKCGNKQSIINFPHPDDLKRWHNQKKIQPLDWKYRSIKESPIYFNTNTMGYRTHEFDFNNDAEYMISLGCSNTYGLYLHEHERYSNLLEKETGIKNYNIGICGGSAGIILMNLSKILHGQIKPPSLVIIQWPERMRLNFPITDPYYGIYNVRASSSYGSKAIVFEEFVKAGNLIETYSLWSKNLTTEMLNKFNIKTVMFSKDEDDSGFYNVPYVKKIDKAYDGKHIGTETNRAIKEFILERL